MLAAKLRAKEKERAAAAEAAAFLNKKDIEAAAARAMREAEKKKEKDRWEDLEREKEAARLEREKIWKTKEYFEINKYGRKCLPEGYPMYFGHHKGVHDAWKPEGPGEQYYEGKKIFDGNFVNGLEHGKGQTATWQGDFKSGQADGIGFYEGKEALVRHNRVICFKEELLDGKQVLLKDPSCKIPNKDFQPKVIILYHVRKWKYQVRYEDEMVPYERLIDFSTLLDFKILHHAPQIYPLGHFKIESDSMPKYQVWEELYGQKERPKLGVVGGRRNGDCSAAGVRTLRQEQAPTSKYDENVFEPRAAGVGAAMELENVELQRELKREQWAKLIDERREVEEEAKRKEVAEEESKQMAENLARQKAKVAETAAEDAAAAARDAEELSKAMEELNKDEDSRFGKVLTPERDKKSD